MIISKGITFGKGIQVGENAQSFPTYSVSVSKTMITENSETVVCTVSTTGILDGTVLLWSTSGTVHPSQLKVTSGYVVVKGNSATITLVSNPNSAVDGPTAFNVRIHSGDINNPPVATSSLVSIVDSSNSTTGQTTFTVPGTYSFTVPNNVYMVHAMCVGGGGSGASSIGKSGGGAGGGLGWKNNIAVNPGQQFTVVVGAGGAGFSTYTAGINGTDSYFISPSTVAGLGGMGGTASGAVATGGSYVGDGGGTGGNGGISTSTANEGQGSGGGGAGGYTGNGGTGGNGQGNQTPGAAPTAGSGGGGGGGGATWGTVNGNGNAQSAGAGGGGVGLLGQGANGTATATPTNYTASTGGGGGSGGTNGGNGTANFAASETSGAGGVYGGGSGGATGAGMSGSPANYVTAAGGGAVRIIWGLGRSYPSSLTADQPVSL
jgi:hypothetical protein